LETVKFAPHAGPLIHKHKEAPGMIRNKERHLMSCADSTHFYIQIVTQKVALPTSSDFPAYPPQPPAKRGLRPPYLVRVTGRSVLGNPGSISTSKARTVTTAASVAGIRIRKATEAVGVRAMA
jgi:hypothetical protein